MSSDNSVHPNLFQTLIWALSLPIPERHLRVLLAILSFMDHESHKAWPSLRMLTERVVILQSDTVHMTMAELIECRLLTRVATDKDGLPRRNAVRVEVGTSLPSDSNPLSASLLQDVVRRIEDVTHIERWVLLAMARTYDWTIEASPIDYKRARNEYPWLSRGQWRATLKRLGQRNIIANVKHGNRHSPPHYALPGLWLHIGHGDPARSHSAWATVTQLNSQIGHGDPAGTEDTEATTSVTATQLEPQIGHGDPAGDSYMGHGDPARIPNPPIYAHAELPTEQVVTVEESDNTTTTHYRSNDSSGANLTADFEAALLENVIPRRGEEYVPAEHDGEDHRLNPIRAAIRRYARQRGAPVHATQAVRLRDYIESADWITGPWGHVGAAKVQLDIWIETGEDLSAPWELPPEPEESKETYTDLAEMRADPEAQRIWEQALGQLRLHVTRPNFSTWLKDTVGLEVAEDHFVLGAPNAFVADMLEQRMYSLIVRTLESILKRDVDVRFGVYLDHAEQEKARFHQ